jgi:hypothetical protein
MRLGPTNRKSFKGGAAAVCAAMILATVTMTGPQASGGVGSYLPVLPTDGEPLDRNAVVAGREALGLDTSTATIERLLAKGASVVEDFRTLLTADEAVVQRTIWDNAGFAGSKVLPAVEKLEGYAGLWIDRSDGAIVVQVKSSVDEITKAILSLDSGAGDKVRFQTVDVSQSELESRVDALAAQWTQLFPGTPFSGIGVATDRSAVVVGVQPKLLDVVRARADDLAALIRPAKLEIKVEEMPSDAACPSRQNCITPTKAGAQINRPSGTSCSQGVHLYNWAAVRHEVLFAGHCRYAALPQSTWYNGATVLGYNIYTMYPALGNDLASVSLAPANASDLVYGWAGNHVDATRWPIFGENIFKDGVTTGLTGGWVTATYHVYTSNTCNCQVHGFASTVWFGNGDSGGIGVGSMESNGTFAHLAAVGGVTAAHCGCFARVQEWMDWAGVYVVI